MPQPILLAWELGGGRGHVLRLASISAALRRVGFEPAFAVQRLDALQAIQSEVGSQAFFQAPVWPGLFGNALQGAQVPRTTLGDSLADLGLRQPAVLEYLVRGWEQLFARIKPAAVVADFAPACLLAARGRVPSVAVGTGYTAPPATARAFAILAGGDSVRKYEEESLLAAVNVALHRLGRQALDRLPAIFAADAAIVATFAELDPYARERDGTYAAPFVPSWDRATPSGGSEIFVYFAETIAAFPAVIASIEHVVRTERTVRLHVPNLDAGIERWLAAAGVSVERMPVPFGQIAARSRLIVSHGSCGIASASLAAGIAQAIIPTDLEKRLIGDAVQRTGAGRSFRTSRDNPLEGALLGQAIVEALHDEALAASARALAPGFAKRLETDPADVVARQVAELV